tara:strand:+ start:300 stop:428 length:129 start_codon:yes stop_codon:yes gene_type:complete
MSTKFAPPVAGLTAQEFTKGIQINKQKSNLNVRVSLKETLAE